MFLRLPLEIRHMVYDIMDGKTLQNVSRACRQTRNESSDIRSRCFRFALNWNLHYYQPYVLGALKMVAPPPDFESWRASNLQKLDPFDLNIAQRVRHVRLILRGTRYLSVNMEHLLALFPSLDTLIYCQKEPWTWNWLLNMARNPYTLYTIRVLQEAEVNQLLNTQRRARLFQCSGRTFEAEKFSNVPSSFFNTTIPTVALPKVAGPLADLWKTHVSRLRHNENLDMRSLLEQQQCDDRLQEIIRRSDPRHAEFVQQLRQLLADLKLHGARMTKAERAKRNTVMPSVQNIINMVSNGSKYALGDHHYETRSRKRPRLR